MHIKTEFKNITKFHDPRVDDLVTLKLNFIGYKSELKEVLEKMLAEAKKCQ
jgi:hypothetical protein